MAVVLYFQFWKNISSETFATWISLHTNVKNYTDLDFCQLSGFVAVVAWTQYMSSHVFNLLLHRIYWIKHTISSSELFSQYYSKTKQLKLWGLEKKSQKSSCHGLFFTKRWTETIPDKVFCSRLNIWLIKELVWSSL